MAERQLAAVLLAAGKGTRMKSELPKVLHPLLGQPLLAHPLERVLELGAHPAIVVVGFGADRVRQAFSHLESVVFVTQAEQLGTGHATLQAKEALEGFDGDVLILPGDAPLIRTSTLRTLVQAHRAERATLTVLTTCLTEPAHYGRIVRGPDGSLERIVEAKDADAAVRAINEINSGIYVVDARFLFQALGRVRNQNAQGEYYLTDIVELAGMDSEPRRACLHGDADELSGVNDRIELSHSEARLRDEINRRWMASGVTFFNPSTIRVENTVRLEPDVVLCEGVQLRGRCRIARGCRIEPGAVLTDVRLEAGVTVGAYAVLTGVTLAAGVTVPPLTVRNSGDEGPRHGP